MDKLQFLTLALCLLVSVYSSVGQQQFSEQNQCQLKNLTAQEPQLRIEAEAGVTEFWDYNEQQFRCAGVAVVRTVIQPRGLLLPQYNNAPTLFFVVQGRGITGVLMSGCPETFQSSGQSYEGEKGQESQRFRDEHQQVRRYQEGDIVALPAGVAHWCYNEGEEDLVLVIMEHTSSYQNQLDNNPRKFFLAGNPQQRQQQGEYRPGGSSQEQHHQNIGNVFHGIDTQVLAEVFGVDQETARRLQGHDDKRGHIVLVEGGLQTIAPPRSRQQEEEQGGREPQSLPANGLEETICSSRLVHDITNPSRADFFNPRAGRINTVNSFNLPILSYLQLSADHVVLYKNAIMAPHWKPNAHTIIYVIRGEGQLQIADQRGESVLNERVRGGQLVVVPQNFVDVKQAGNEGLEWIAFRTNDNAIFQTLSGRTSALRAMPVDVLSNAYQISREEARRLKLNREEVFLLEPSQRSQRVPV